MVSYESNRVIFSEVSSGSSSSTSSSSLSALSYEADSIILRYLKIKKLIDGVIFWLLSRNVDELGRSHAGIALDYIAAGQLDALPLARYDGHVVGDVEI